VDDDVHAYMFDAYDISIIAFRGNFEIVYEPSQTLSIHEVGQSFKYRYLVNGSFFEWSGKHAGWLSISGNNLMRLKPDRQLTHCHSQYHHRRNGPQIGGIMGAIYERQGKH
jgi:hypothetical protein